MNFNFTLVGNESDFMPELSLLGIGMGVGGYLIGMIVFISYNRSGDNMKVPAVFGAGGTALLLLSMGVGIQEQKSLYQDALHQLQQEKASSIIQQAETLYGLTLQPDTASTLLTDIHAAELNQGKDTDTFWAGEAASFYENGELMTVQLAWIGDHWGLVDLTDSTLAPTELPRLTEGEPS